MMIDAFLPTLAGSVTIPVGVASSTTTIPIGTPGQQNPQRSGGEYLELNNTGTAAIFIEICTPAQIIAATVAASYPILAGHCKIVRRAEACTIITAISGSAGQSLIVSVGNGI